jgi:H+-translocating diphosphatase
VVISFDMAVSDDDTSKVILIISIAAIFWAIFNYSLISMTSVETNQLASPSSHGCLSEVDSEKQTALLIEIYEAIRAGANAFLLAEYRICAIFCLFFFAIIVGLVSWGENSTQGGLTGLAFALGAITSILSGYIGMTVAVYSNVRTAVNAQKEGFSHCFNTAFRAGSVMGFALNGLGLLVLYVTLYLYRNQYHQDNWDHLMECISGYGLGGSTIAMFGRVGGGIYTKAADVGADLVGKVVHGIPEDDPRNPATIADNVGDNVGDVAGTPNTPTLTILIDYEFLSHYPSPLCV